MALIFCNNKLVKHQQCDEPFSPKMQRLHATTLFGRAPSGSSSTAENTTATLFIGAAPLPPLLLSQFSLTCGTIHWSSGARFRWLRWLHTTVVLQCRAGDGESPPKRGLHLCSHLHCNRGAGAEPDRELSGRAGCIFPVTRRQEASLKDPI